MHDPDERPRLRLRMLAWSVAAVILVPVLYVAAAGPMAWWVFYRCDRPRWHADYKNSLAPLYQSRAIHSSFIDYCEWWKGLPAPRSWRRQLLARRVADLHRVVAKIHSLSPTPEAGAELDPHSTSERWLRELAVDIAKAEAALRQFDAQ